MQKTTFSKNTYYRHFLTDLHAQGLYESEILSRLKVISLQKRLGRAVCSQLSKNTQNLPKTAIILKMYPFALFLFLGRFSSSSTL